MLANISNALKAGAQRSVSTQGELGNTKHCTTSFKVRKFHLLNKTAISVLTFQGRMVACFANAAECFHNPNLLYENQMFWQSRPNKTKRIIGLLLPKYKAYF